MTMCHVQEWQLSLSYFPSYFPLTVSGAISCLLHNLNALWYIIIIRNSYDKQVLTMCCLQEWQLSPLYFLCFLPLMVKATMHSILNTVRNIFMRLHDSIEEVGIMCLVQKNMVALVFISSSYLYSGPCCLWSGDLPSPLMAIFDILRHITFP